MQLDRWQRVQDLYFKALELPDDRRVSFLKAACSNDPEMLQEVKTLLQCEDKIGHFLEPFTADEIEGLGEPNATLNLEGADETRGLIPTSRTQALLGSRVSHYRILSLLGTGGMGQVYLALDENLERNVAIKFLPTHLKEDSDNVGRFIREARAISALNHPHIVTIHESSECELGLYIVMEFVEGRTLRETISQGLSYKELLEYATQMAKAISASHAAGIVHRDVKPENIMIRNDGYVKVLDFGLARLTFGGKVKPISEVGVVMGTARYMSPEQARGTNVSPPSDIFSLGLVFYEMACGRHPFEAKSRQGVLQAITGQRVLPPSMLNRTLPERFDQLILGMLEKRPSLRPLASDVVLVLDELSAGTPQPQRTEPLVFNRPRTVVRESQRKELISALTYTASRGSLLFCVSGEAGLGKTTLVEDFLQEVSHAPEGRLVGRGRCSELTAGGEPYLAVLGAIDSLLVSDETGWVARVLKTVAPNWYLRLAPADEKVSSRVQAQTANGSPELMKRELGTLFQALSRERQLILFFDDLHWADDSTVDAISYLTSQFDRNGFLMIAAYRESELRLARKSFLGLKLNLQARNQCREIDLGCLSQVEVEGYLTLEFPENNFPEDFGYRIHRRTEGHPLFMADLVRYLKGCQTIFDENGVWALRASFSEAEKQLPESVRSMIQRKVGLINEEELRILEAASIQGYEFDSAVTTKVLEMDPLKVEERLENLERLHHFVRLVGEQDMPSHTVSCRYHFVHSLYQNAFLAGLRPVRRKKLTSATARVLEDLYGDRRGEVAGLLASLHDTCGEFGRATEYYLVAAQNAASLFAHKEASQMARRGLEMLRGLPRSPERDKQELVLQLTLGRSVSVTSGYTDPEAAACFTRAQELAPLLGEEAQFFPAIWGLWVCRFVKAETAETAELIQQLQGMAKNSSDPILLAGAYYAMALQCEITGDLVRVKDHSEQVINLGKLEKNSVRVSRLVLDPVVSAQGVNIRVLWLMGYPDKARAGLTDELARIDIEKWDPRSVCDVLISASVVQKFCGNSSEVGRLSTQAIAICDKHEFSVEREWALFNRGWALAASGSTDEGIAEMEASLDDLFSRGVMLIAGTVYASELAETLLRVGKPDRAHQRVKEALSFVKRSGHCVFASELHRIEGNLMARARGDADKVEECFEQAIEIARQQQARSLELRAATSLARFRASVGKKKKAYEILGPVYGSFTEGFDTSDLLQAKTVLEELR